jgi:hypothetical protein
MSAVQQTGCQGWIRRRVRELLRASAAGLRSKVKRNRLSSRNFTFQLERSDVAGRRLTAWLSQMPFHR